jgi:peptide chain release factor 2
MSAPGFWDKPETAQEVGRKRARVEKRIASGEEILNKDSELDVLLELQREGEHVDADVEEVMAQLETEITAIEMTMKLSGEHDERDVILAIHPGAGGTESQDWAEMLLRMYLRYAERKGWSAEIVDYQSGEEAGLKSATVMVRGDYAYGYMKSEHGVHRLVRISPFDAAKRRHTSFASVYVYPDIDEEIEIEINDKDLRVDTYRSSGAGGQHVNVTDSAVRITHLPSGIVVSCQNERSQTQNKAKAMQILAARLAERQREEHRKEIEALSGDKRDVAFGNQIRTYTLAPYQLVKDERTRYETGNVQAVLDGDLDAFIEAYLQWRRREGAEGVS